MRIEHIAMYVEELEGARDFFITYLNGRADQGYLNPTTGFRSYFIEFEDGTRLELMHKPQMTDAGKKDSRSGYAHIAFSVGSREAVDEISQILSAAGYPLLSGPRMTGDGYYESCIAAFEGNLIEITV